MSLGYEALVNRISTRKVEQLTRSLGIDGILASQVLEIARGLDERVEEFRIRQIGGISAAHQGIQSAVKKEWLGASWQRCKVHFMRNILAKVPHRDKARLGEQLK